MFVGRVEHFGQIADTRDCPLNCDFEEAKAAFRGLFALLGIIRIEIAHEDFVGLTGQATARRASLSGQLFCSDFAT